MILTVKVKVRNATYCETHFIRNGGSVNNLIRAESKEEVSVWGKNYAIEEQDMIYSHKHKHFVPFFLFLSLFNKKATIYLYVIILGFDFLSRSRCMKKHKGWEEWKSKAMTS